MTVLLDPGTFVTRYAIGLKVSEIPMQESSQVADKTGLSVDAVEALAQYALETPGNESFQNSANALFDTEQALDFVKLADLPQFTVNSSAGITLATDGPRVASKVPEKMFMTLPASPKVRAEVAQRLLSGPINQLFFLEPPYAALLAAGMTRGTACILGQELLIQSYQDGFWPAPGASVGTPELGGRLLAKNLTKTLLREFKIELTSASLAAKRAAILFCRGALTEAKISLPDGSILTHAPEAIEALENFRENFKETLRFGLGTHLNHLQASAWLPEATTGPLLISGGLTTLFESTSQLLRSEKPWLDGIEGLRVTAAVIQDAQMITKARLEEAGEALFWPDR